MRPETQFANVLYQSNSHNQTEIRLGHSPRSITKKFLVFYLLLLSLKIIFPIQMKATKKKKNNPTQICCAWIIPIEWASIRELWWDWQQSLLSAHWEVNARWKLLFIQNSDVQLNHYICTLYYLLHTTQTIRLILIRPMLFDRQGETRMRSEDKKRTGSF